MQGPLQFELDPGRITRKLVGIALGLLTLHMLASYLWADGGPDVVSYRYVNMFDLDEEEGFGTWFAAVMLLCAGRLLLVIARDSRSAGDGLHLWWLVLGLGFHFLSIDEVAGMHEFLNTYGDDVFGLASKWTTYAAVGVGMLVVAYLPFLVLLQHKGHRRTLSLVVIAGILYVGGAVGVEKLSPDSGFSSLTYNLFWISLEEGLEMSGVIVLIYALLDYLRGGSGHTLRIEFATRANAETGPHQGSPPAELATPRPNPRVDDDRAFERERHVVLVDESR
jgi:hypothetical protein